jgi:hypothetical protein
MAAGLGQAANRVHGGCTQPNEKISRTNQGEGLLLFDGAMGDGPEDVRIKTSVAGQLLSIDLIALAIAVRDRTQLPHVRHNDLVPELL